MTPKPVRRIVFDNPPLIAGTAKMITPIRSTITPRFFNNSFMVIAIITRLQKYFGTKMMKPLNLAFIFVK